MGRDGAASHRRGSKGADVSAIDKWSGWDLGGNGRDAFEKNRRAEGAPEIDLYDGLAQDMPFPDKTFDLVISHFVVHNISGRKERERAIAEMVRVLPGGTLSDIKIHHNTERFLRKTAFRQERIPFIIRFRFRNSSLLSGLR